MIRRNPHIKRMSVLKSCPTVLLRYISRTGEWIKENNPHAMLNITERLLEAEKRGMWNISSEKLKELRKIYLEIEGDVEEIEE